MSNLENGREAVKLFLKENRITDQDIATAYGKSRVWVQRVLSGKERGPAVNKFILEIIRDYKIR